MALLDLCIPLDKDLEKLSDDLDSLEGYAVAIRYPGGIVPLALAEEAYKTAGRICKFAMGKLKIK
jgi:hypothetical protein